jgi:glycosyltransferase involved in cell wall biosynthesis
MRRATRGEVCLDAGKAVRVSVLVASTAGFDRPLLTRQTRFAVAQAGQRANPGRKTAGKSDKCRFTRNRSGSMSDACELTILMPCLNEAETLASCISKARSFLARSGCAGEVIVADNGSTDGSQAIAAANGAEVVHVSEQGYGSALLGGIRAARGKYVIMGDSDDSYDFSRLDAFVEQLRAGYQLVMGNRFRGGILPGAMPALHRHLGNPVLTAIGRLFFSSSFGDFHCGLRGFDRQAILALDLQASGMEFASEMVVKASIAKLRSIEVPTMLSPDGRSRPPHLRSWRDGWRHLRFLLLFSPRWLFLYPGVVLFVIGCLGIAWLLPRPRLISGIGFDVHSLAFASLAAIVGVQSMMFWVCAKIYGMQERIVPPDPWFNALISRFRPSVGLILGAALVLVGGGLSLSALNSWSAAGLGPIAGTGTMRIVILSGTVILLGFQVIFSTFLVSLLRQTGPD